MGGGNESIQKNSKKIIIEHFKFPCSNLERSMVFINQFSISTGLYL
jgi:hypothetical protein